MNFVETNMTHPGQIIVLNGPSGAGKSSIQREFQKVMAGSLWVKVGVDNLFDNPLPDITLENISFWQSKNPLRWVEESQDTDGNKIISLFVGPLGQKVAYAMNDSIAAYAENGCNVIVDYIAYNQQWLKHLEKICAHFKTYYIAVKCPLKVLEQREETRGTSPKGHARSHFFTVYGNKEYDLIVDSQKSSAYEIAQNLKQLIENK